MTNNHRDCDDGGVAKGGGGGRVPLPLGERRKACLRRRQALIARPTSLIARVAIVHALQDSSYFLSMLSEWLHSTAFAHFPSLTRSPKNYTTAYVQKCLNGLVLRDRKYEKRAKGVND